MSIHQSNDVEDLFFRDIHPNVFVRTAIDRYAGWVGQIYSKERYAQRLTRPTKVGGGR